MTSVLASVLVISLQLRLMQVAGTAQTLAAAGNHAALNLANALGAWVGGLVIAAGYGYTAPSLVAPGSLSWVSASSPSPSSSTAGTTRDATLRPAGLQEASPADPAPVAQVS